MSFSRMLRDSVRRLYTVFTASRVISERNGILVSMSACAKLPCSWFCLSSYAYFLRSCYL